MNTIKATIGKNEVTVYLEYSYNDTNGSEVKGLLARIEKQESNSDYGPFGLLTKIKVKKIDLDITLTERTLVEKGKYFQQLKVIEADGYKNLEGKTLSFRSYPRENKDNHWAMFFDEKDGVYKNRATINPLTKN